MTLCKPLWSALAGAILTAFLTAPAVADPIAADLMREGEEFQRGWLAYEREDYATALEIWLPLAENGNLNAQINVGLLYDYGLGVERDVEIATRWYLEGADRNDELAQYNLAMLYVEREEANFEEALYWLERAADQEFPEAQYELGSLICRGKGRPADPTEGIEWLYRAGVNYLTRGNGDGAKEAVAAIREREPSHERAQELEEQIASLGISDSDPTNGGVSALSVGTAWPISGGYAVTNHHVVAGNSRLTLVNAAGEEFEATIALSDVENDIALLRVDDPQLLPPALPLAGDRPRLGTSVFTIGFPRIDVMGTAPKLTQGVISATSGVRDDPSTYQISVPIQPGNSGGPLLDMEGRVVGVVASMLGAVSSESGTPTPLPNVNYAVKVEILKQILALVPVDDRAQGVLEPGPNSLVELADRIRDSVLIVKAQ